MCPQIQFLPQNLKIQPLLLKKFRRCSYLCHYSYCHNLTPLIVNFSVNSSPCISTQPFSFWNSYLFAPTWLNANSREIIINFELPTPLPTSRKDLQYLNRIYLLYGYIIFLTPHNSYFKPCWSPSPFTLNLNIQIHLILHRNKKNYYIGNSSAS